MSCIGSKRQLHIVISETHDVPLLLLVRNAGYITHERLIALSGYDKSQSSVCSRRRCVWLHSNRKTERSVV